MFVSASTVAPRSRAMRIAASVSAVSPDCVMPMTRSPGPDDRVAVAVLGGDVHLDRDARPLLDRVAPDEAGVVARAAGDDDDPLDVAQQRLVEGAHVVEVDAVGAHGAVGDRLGHRVGLLVDLLEHEGLEAALLGGLLVPVDLDDLALELGAVGQHERRALGRDLDDLAVLDVLDLARLAQEGGDGAGEEGLALAATDDQRALLARADERLGLVERHRDERVVALELVVGGAHGLEQRARSPGGGRSGGR